MENAGERTDQRSRLPSRRQHEVYRFESYGQICVGGVGRFADGGVAELFVNAAKSGSMVEAIAQDAAIVASLALQFGCPLDVLRHAIRAQATPQARWRPFWMKWSKDDERIVLPSRSVPFGSKAVAETSSALCNRESDQLLG